MLPFLIIVPCTTVITGLFNLAAVLPTPVALLVGAGWGVALGLLVTWLRSRRPRLADEFEDGFVFFGTAGFAFAACGGLMEILLLNGALDSPSLTGQALQSMFMPSLPYFRAVNGLLEILLIPGALYLGWRAGGRRILIVSAALMYFAMRLWTYLTFVPARLGWAYSDHNTQPLTSGERRQAASDLMLNDPRWAFLLVMFALFLLAAYMPAIRRQPSART